MKIRPETPADRAEIFSANQLAFGGRDAEGRLVDAIRTTEYFIPELSLVAEQDGKIVGHILFSRIQIAGPHGQMDALALAPMAVLPKYQGRGIGSALVHHGLEACKRLGHTIVIVLGQPGFYPRFGFSVEMARSLDCPFGEAGDAWMALELVPGALQGVSGKVIYPPAFNEV